MLNRHFNDAAILFSAENNTLYELANHKPLSTRDPPSCHAQSLWGWQCYVDATATKANCG